MQVNPTLNLIINCFLWYVSYSAFGWVMETLIFAIRDKKSCKRGFLFGPLCPIYGTGAVVCRLLLYNRFHNFFVLFFVGMVLCDTIEYFTAVVMEKAFHTKWWDYSYQKFNIQGRISLFSSVLFGGGIAILMKWIQPFVEDVTNRIPFTGRAVAAFIIYSILVVDVTLTIQSLKDVILALKEVQQYAVDNFQQGIDVADEKIDNMVEKLKTTEISTDRFKRKSHIDDVISNLDSEKSQLRRIRHLFPKVQFENYKDAMKMVFSHSDKGDSGNGEKEDKE